MSIPEGMSEIVFACYRPPNLIVTGNSAAKDSAIADAWRMSSVRCATFSISSPTLGHAWIGTAHHSSGKPAEALHHAERLFALSPMPLAAGVLGDALVSAGESVRAGKLLEQLKRDATANLIARASDSARGPAPSTTAA
jgi:hypothetical protein